MSAILFSIASWVPCAYHIIGGVIYDNCIRPCRIKRIQHQDFKAEDVKIVYNDNLNLRRDTVFQPASNIPQTMSLGSNFSRSFVFLNPDLGKFDFNALRFLCMREIFHLLEYHHLLSSASAAFVSAITAIAIQTFRSNDMLSPLLCFIPLIAANITYKVKRRQCEERADRLAVQCLSRKMLLDVAAFLTVQNEVYQNVVHPVRRHSRLIQIMKLCFQMKDKKFLLQNMDAINSKLIEEFGSSNLTIDETYHHKARQYHQDAYCKYYDIRLGTYSQCPQ